MARSSLLIVFVLGLAACASNPQLSVCASQIHEAQVAYDAADARLKDAEAAASKAGNPQSFGKVASAAADVAGAQAALDSAKGDCHVAP